MSNDTPTSYLIQRLNDPWTIDPTKGFDGFFSLDYMGAAEYEFGAVGDSLRRIRSTGKAVVWSRDVTHEGTTRTVHFVGNDLPAPQKNDWYAIVTANLNGARTKMASRFPSYFSGETDEFDHVVAWWSLDCDFGWSLDEAVAERLALAYNTPKA